jgi:hypothetical protein
MAPTEALSEVSDLRAVATGAILRKREIGEHGRWKYRLQADVNDNCLERVAMVSSNNNRYEVRPDDSVPDVTTNRAELRHGQPRKAIIDSVQRSGSTAGELQKLRNVNGGVSVVRYPLCVVLMNDIVLMEL